MGVRCALPSSVTSAPITALALANCSSEAPNGIVGLTLSVTNTSTDVVFAPDAFSNFTNLTCLSMKGMGLTAVPSDLFRGLTKLKSIDLSANRIPSVPPDFLDNLVQLETLDLSSNQLTHFPPHALSGLDQLTSLNLSSNRLSSLPSIPPPRWPIGFDLRLANNSDLEPCWQLNGTRLVGPPPSAWWCNAYSSILTGVYLRPLTFFRDSLVADLRNSSRSGDILVWHSPDDFLYDFASGTVWHHRYGVTVSKVRVAPATGQVQIDNFRPYFRGLWTCLRVRRDGRVEVVRQLLLRCASPLRSIYIWSLIVSGISTAAMVVAGLIISFARLLINTRCFTRKIHVISTMSLEDLQYSPRTQRKRLAILRHYEASRAAMLAAHDAGGDAALIASTPVSIDEHSIDETTAMGQSPSPPPHWLPPHRLAYFDLFAHGGGVSGGEEGDDSDSLPSEDDGEEGERWKDRLRQGMVKHVAEVRERMREQRHNMEESTSRMMRHLRSGSQVAALKVRSGLVSSMDVMKWKVRNITELCGRSGGAGLGQTVSVSTLVTDLDTQMTVERRVVNVTDV